MTHDTNRFERRLERERRARKEAELLLEQKSRDLYKANQLLQAAHDELEKRVQERTQTLEITNAQLHQEILERQKTQRELATARDKALEVSRLKSEFLANMSHEIRTPLNAIIGLANLLLDTKLNAEQADFLQTIHTSGDVLLTIINDILDFSRIEANKLELEHEPFKLTNCIEDAIDLLAQKAFNKNIELVYFAQPPLPERFVGDISRLRQILVNLINNALKFTEVGEVVLRVEGEKERDNLYKLHFSVRDTGIGIPQAQLSRLFNAFSQVDASTTRKYGGAGLGLAISKQLSEMMDGTMWVESEVGQGSTFHFTVHLQGAESDDISPLYLTQAGLKDAKVLIVDDNETNRHILQRQTAAWGMQPTAVSSGIDALTLIRQGEQAFDIAILDMQMPEMHGVTLAKLIRSEAVATLPLIMLSSIGTRPEGVTADLFAAYATKPIKPSALQESLLRALGQQEVEGVKQTLTIDKSFAAERPLRILIAEDNLINQKVVLSMFKRMGYRPDMASNGLEAVQALQRQLYDVIFMDVQMPEMDGIEATRRIKAEWGADTCPRIVALTANALKGDRERFLAAGMDDYVSKPVRINELAEAILHCQRLPPPLVATPPR